MKVAFFTNSTKMGGAEHSLVDVYRVCNFDKKLVALEFGPLIERLIEEDCNVYSSRGKRGILFEVCLKFTFLYRQFSGVDLVYANGNKTYLISLVYKFIFFRRFKIIWHVRDAFDKHHFGFIRFLVGLSTHLPNVNLIFNSEYSGRALTSSFGRTGVVIYNGFDLNTWRGVGLSPKNKSDKVRMISTSRISPWKGQLELIEALGDIEEDFELIMCGGALFGEDDYLKEIKRKITLLNLEDKVKIIGNVDDLPSLLNSGGFDLVLHTAVLPEPFGRCVVEAILSGLPVVASKGGGVQEIVGDSEAAFLFDPDIRGELSKALRKAIGSVRNIETEIQILRDEVANKFSIRELAININKEIGRVK